MPNFTAEELTEICLKRLPEIKYPDSRSRSRNQVYGGC